MSGRDVQSAEKVDLSDTMFAFLQQKMADLERLKVGVYALTIKSRPLEIWKSHSETYETNWLS